MICFGKDVLGDYHVASRKEYLLTNKANCYSSSTVLGVNTRKYHGLLVADNVLYLAKLDEKVNGVHLGVNKYSNTIPEGCKYIEYFELYPPKFIYFINGTIIKKTIKIAGKKKAVAVDYEISSPDTEFIDFEIVPLVTERSIHSLRREFDFSQESGKKKFRVNRLTVESNIEFNERKDVYFNFFYEREFERGYDYEENLFTPGLFCTKFKGNRRIRVLAYVGNPFGKVAMRQEIESDSLRSESYVDWLKFSSKTFIVNSNDIRAGFHWFPESWGRDTFISLPGLLLTSGKFDIAKKVIKLYARHLKNGLIPNILPDKFNSADASLWFVYSIKKYYDYTKEEKFLDEVRSYVKEIIEKYPTNDSVKLDEDGFIKVGPCLTWMDTKFTPRDGKPVDINSLWYNTLSTAEDIFGIECGSKKFRKRFKAFLTGNQLYDRLDPNDNSVRPNQVFSIALPYTPLAKSERKMILDTLTRELLTPYGLRTLSPADAGYYGAFSGDKTYHNGCAWAWLLGFYITGYMRVYGDEDYCKDLLKPMLEHIKDAGLGTISEIFDGDAPYTPNGCISQAWSVAEVLRCMTEDLNMV